MDKTKGRDYFKKRIEKHYNQLALPKSSVGKNLIKYYSEGKDIENRERNRYPDVVPYNQYRVILKNKQNDYINASYIPGIKGEKTYISAQAPLPGTIEDFYCMLIENNVSCVCMLTKMKERGKVKAHSYWPSKKYVLNSITIELLSNNKLKEGLIKREIRVTRGDESIVINHFHYTEWPDMGIPKNTEAFIKLINEVRDIQESNNNTKTVLAHCSAGIGRAGAFLVVYSYLEYYFNNDKKTIFKITNKMREQRLGMVQTYDQYYFIHIVLKQYFNAYGLHYKKNQQIETVTSSTEIDNDNNNNLNDITIDSNGTKNINSVNIDLYDNDDDQEDDNDDDQEVDKYSDKISYQQTQNIFNGTNYETNNSIIVRKKYSLGESSNNNETGTTDKNDNNDITGNINDNNNNISMNDSFVESSSGSYNDDEYFDNIYYPESISLVNETQLREKNI